MADALTIDLSQINNQWAINKISWSTVKLLNGKIVFSYAPNSISFSNFVNINGNQFPKEIDLTACGKFADFAGRDIARILGKTEQDVLDTQYEIITHRYIVKSIDVLAAGYQPEIKLTKDLPIYDHFTDEYLHLPSDQSVKSVNDVLSLSQ
jgi:hypothetical protein